MKRVIIESPYSGLIQRNTTYARLCMFDSIIRGEAPFASHLLYTQPYVLDDTIPSQRDHGMRAGFVWMSVADLVAVYLDNGCSSGMTAGINMAKECGVPIEYRYLSPRNDPKGKPLEKEED